MLDSLDLAFMLVIIFYYVNFIYDDYRKMGSININSNWKRFCKKGINLTFLFGNNAFVYRESHAETLAALNISLKPIIFNYNKCYYILAISKLRKSTLKICWKEIWPEWASAIQIAYYTS